MNIKFIGNEYSNNKKKIIIHQSDNDYKTIYPHMPSNQNSKNPAMYQTEIIFIKSNQFVKQWLADNW